MSVVRDALALAYRVSISGAFNFTSVSHSVPRYTSRSIVSHGRCWTAFCRGSEELQRQQGNQSGGRRLGMPGI